MDTQQNQHNDSTHRGCPVCSSLACELFLKEKINPKKLSAYSYASRKEPEFMRHKLVKCTSCSLVYANTPPSTSFLASAYAEADYDSQDDSACAAQTYISVLHTFLQALPKALAVDVGAGDGSFLPHLQSAGFTEVVGIEPSSRAIAAAPPEVRQLLREDIFTSATLHGKEASFISSFMTLEHMPDPMLFFNSSFQALQPGGGIAVIVHNYDALANKILGEKSPIIDIEHLQLFSVQSIHEALLRSGFSDIHIHTFRNSYYLSYWARLLPLPTALKRCFIKALSSIQLNRTTLSINVGNIIATARKL